MNILQINSSARRDASHSTRLATRVVDRLRETAPDSTLVLKDGSTVAVRPVEAHDEAALTSFYGGLSPSSLAFRFFAAPQDVAEVVMAKLLGRWDWLAIAGHRDGTPKKPDPAAALAIARDAGRLDVLKREAEA